MLTFVTVFHIIICVTLILVIMLQSSKAEGLQGISMFLFIVTSIALEVLGK